MNQEALDAVIEKHRLWLKGDSEGVRADLSHRDLSELSLAGAQLHRVNMEEANLRDANLQNACLQHANLRRAILRNADLQGANLVGANLQHANLWKANIRNTFLWGTKGNRREIKSIFCFEEYSVVYTHDYLWIGCQRRLINKWKNLSDKAILKMDGEKGLGFSKKWKETIFDLIEKNPAKETGNED